MRTAVRLVAVGLWVCSTVLLAVPALAQDRVADLERALRADDFRVRTQAALALGASESGRAVTPLCSALNDENTTVRAASASAIGRLAQGGEQCLADRLRVEPNPDVKGVIQRALDRLREKQGGGVDGNTRYYLAIGEVTNKSRRSKQSVDAEIRKRLVGALSRLSGYALAPASESPDRVVQLKREHPQLKAYFVWPKLELGYTGRTLSMRLELSLFSYPEKAFLGSVARKLSMPDTPEGDTGSENELIEMAADQLAPDLARTLSRL
jgi:hypothetical protein